MEEQNGNYKKRPLWQWLLVYAAIGAILYGIVYYTILGGKKESNTTQLPPQNPQTTTETVAPIEEKTFSIKGTNFKFMPNQISVKKGDKVKIVFQDDEGFHDLVIDGYNVKTERINQGDTSEVAFVADKTGSFDYYCSVGNHKAQGMTGTLVVE